MPASKGVRFVDQRQKTCDNISGWADVALQFLSVFLLTVTNMPT